MTYIKVDDNLDLVVTVAEPIFQGENLSKSVTFLVPKKVGELYAAAALAYLVYIRADGHADIVYLKRETEMYDDDYYQYIVTIPERVTRYAGEIVLWLEFYSGRASNPVIVKTGSTVMNVIEHHASADRIDDRELSIIYQLHSKLVEATDDIKLSDNEVILFDENQQSPNIQTDPGIIIFSGGSEPEVVPDDEDDGDDIILF